MPRRPSAAKTGKFKIALASMATPPTNPTTIVRGSANAVYRLINIGRRTIKVTSAAGTVDLFKRQTLDVSTDGTTITVGGNDGETIEAVFERLGPDVACRPGRFRHTAPTANALTLIDLRASTGAVSYRLYNSGENDMRVEFNVANGIVVGPGNTLDFEIAGQRLVTVKCTVNNQAIEGIFDVVQFG